MLKVENSTGIIVVDEAVIYNIVSSAATKCFGVAGMVPGSNKQRLFRFFSKKDLLDQGIVVSGSMEHFDVELHIMVVYGMNINAIAQSIVHKVKYTVKDLTGIEVKKVTVKVDGIKE